MGAGRVRVDAGATEEIVRSGSLVGEEVVERCKEKLSTLPGVLDISDDSRPGI